jgi:hypothetical protein
MGGVIRVVEPFTLPDRAGTELEMLGGEFRTK